MQYRTLPIFPQSILVLFRVSLLQLCAPNNQSNFEYYGLVLWGLAFYVNGVIQHVLFCVLFSFTQQGACVVHYLLYFIPFYCWVIFNCANIPKGEKGLNRQLTKVYIWIAYKYVKKMLRSYVMQGNANSRQSEIEYTPSRMAEVKNL